ncbi:unnamed protein product [Moneuplotes crassus]|uniref:FYVE-type domain-containing protein n=1 Tax=Euplotes crassus TaxID=5936 RepID=A0AAD1XFW1_EUPCR|nr:unnamed protein product [Moneuplotes crassus]
MRPTFDEKNPDNLIKLFRIRRQESRNSEALNGSQNMAEHPDYTRDTQYEPETPLPYSKYAFDEDPSPKFGPGDNVMKQNNLLREELIKLRCNFEAEKFSMQYYSSKIEKELQKILFENHYLRQTMNKMNNVIKSLSKIIKRSCKMYLSERESPPAKVDFNESESESDFNDPQFLPIENLQDKIEQLLLDYRENISLFSETNAHKAPSFKNSGINFEGLHSRSHSEGKKMLSLHDSRRSFKKSSMIKKTSIYSGRFGKHKNYSDDHDDDKEYLSNLHGLDSAGNLDDKDAEDLIFENERIRWIPNDAYENCQICKTEFTVLYRKHHCRSCGILVCDACSPHREYVGGYRDERVRVCKTCVPQFEKINDIETRSFVN